MKIESGVRAWLLRCGAVGIFSAFAALSGTSCSTSSDGPSGAGSPGRGRPMKYAIDTPA